MTQDATKVIEQLVEALSRICGVCEIEGDGHRDGNKWHRLCDESAPALSAGQQYLQAQVKQDPGGWQPASNPPPESAGEVLVLMPNGGCEIAWPTYWHGASNAFAQWTFRDPDEDRQPTHWMPLPPSPKGTV